MKPQLLTLNGQRFWCTIEVVPGTNHFRGWLRDEDGQMLLDQEWETHLEAENAIRSRMVEVCYFLQG